ncbi:MAG: hypothetical protein AAF399_27490, partial [Bacteroidota bacterium]
MDISVSQSEPDGCGPQIVSFEDSSFAIGSPPLQYDWTVLPFPANADYSYLNGTDSTSASPEIQLDGPGDYTIIVEITGFCDVVTDTFFFSVLAPPQIGLTLSTDTICEGECVLFDISSEFTNASLLSSTFSSGINTFSPAPPFPYDECYPAAGVYPILYVEENICGIDSVEAEVVVNDLINANISYDVTDGCVPLDVAITNTSFLDQGPPLTYQWTVTGGVPLVDWNFSSGNANSAEPQFTFETAGSYTVCVQINGICDTVVLCQVIEAREAPEVFLNPANSILCLGEQVTFNYGSLNFTNDIGTFVFDPGISPPQSPPFPSPQTITYDLPGVYPVTFSETNSCGADIASAQVVVRDTIHPDVSIDITDACAPYTAIITNNSFVLEGSPIFYLWTISGGATLDDPLAASPTVTIPQAGDYLLCVTMIGDCDTVQICETLIGREAPEVALQPDSSILCVGDCLDLFTGSLNFTNTTETLIFFDGVNFVPVGSAPDTLEVCFPLPGTYELFYVESNVCGIDSSFAFVEVRDTIHEDIVPDTTNGCVDLTVNYTNNSFSLQGPPITYQWTVDNVPNPGPGDTWAYVTGNDTSSAPSFIFTAAGDYLVQVILTNDCDVDTLSWVISAFEPPVASLLPDSSILCVTDCLDLFTGSLNFTNTTQTVTFFDGVNFVPIGGAPDTIEVCFPLPGTYDLFYTETNVCGTSVDSAFVEVRDTIHADIVPDTTNGCVDLTVNFTNNSFSLQGPPITYQWTV